MARAPIATVLAIVVLGSLSAAADEKKEEAERLFLAAERLFESGQYEEAADNFERAYEVLPLPAIAFSAAQAYRLQYFKDRKDAFLKRAVELYRRYIEEQREGGRITDAVSFLAELEPILARAEKRGAVAEIVREEKTGIVVTSQIKGALGSVNGSKLATMPLTVKVEPGKHEVRVEAEGYAPLTKTVDVVKGQVLPVEGALNPLPVKVVIKAKGGSRVTVDGSVVGTTPMAAPIELEAGSHFVAVSRRGHRPYARQFLGGRGETITLDAPLPRTRQRKVSYVVLGVGATLGLGAALSGVAALGANSEAKKLDDIRSERALTPLEAQAYNDHLDDRSRANTAALGLLSVGLATTAVGALLYFLDNPSPDAPPETPRIVPTASADGGGLVLSGSF